MRGFPKKLNTKFDYEYVREHFPKEVWLPHWQSLIDTMNAYFFVRYLDEGEEAVLTSNQRIEEPQEQSQETRRALYELRVNPHCKLLNLGFTEDEVQAVIAE